MKAETAEVETEVKVKAVEELKAVVKAEAETV